MKWLVGIVAVVVLLVFAASCWLTDAAGNPVFLPGLHKVLEPLGFC